MNDTIELCRNEFDNGKLAISTELGDNGNRIIKSFFENGLVIGQITVDNKMKIKSIDSNTYYENGKIKEQKNYHEKINAH
jgi:antitoxin component YwqK of YwqJK toxin-antitoxin module